MKFEYSKIDITQRIEDILLNEPNIHEECVKHITDGFDSLFKWGLEKFGIAPTIENMTRVKVYSESAGLCDRHIYIDGRYVFSICWRVEWFDSRTMAANASWCIKIFDKLIGTTEWRAE